jgi:hypothetical protein
MLSEAEIRIIAGIIAAIEAGTLGLMAYVYLYELVKSKTKWRFLDV